MPQDNPHFIDTQDGAALRKYRNLVGGRWCDPVGGTKRTPNYAG